MSGMEPADKVMRRAMQVLDAIEAFAIHKEAFRLGWIAGRDAAADFMSDLDEPAYAEGIRQLEQIT